MKHQNNNLKPSSHARCKCGRDATIGEYNMGIGLNGIYSCPECKDKYYETYPIQ